MVKGKQRVLPHIGYLPTIVEPDTLKSLWQFLQLYLIQEKALMM